MKEPRLDRRAFLHGGAGAVAGAALALGGRAAWDAGSRPGAEPAVDDPGARAAGHEDVGRATVPFYGERQAGVATPAPAFASFVALDLVAGTDRDALRRLLRIWTDDAARLTAGRPGLADTEPELALVPASLTVTLGLGPGVFAVPGLEPSRPEWLAPLPPFAVDRLEEAWSGGDVLLQVCADDEVTVAHAVRVLVKEARTFATVRWVQRGFRRAAGTTAPGTTMRNLMGQVDGTRNLVPGQDDALVWHDAAAPAWLAHGTSAVVRRVAMNLDTWDEVDRPAREVVVGRRLDDGAPLTGSSEHDEPDLEAVDAVGLPVIDVAAHIRRARTADPQERFLRRSYNIDDAPPPGALSASGLLFVAYQRDPVRQLVPVQTRLAELDLLNTWTTPVGSAVFAVPGGCREGEYLAQRLVEP
ncbi:Dyp-type peroxidase [Actinotalea subterranea]|uniref:Dyp-type peroxidase n=1 Tax=Actinotalea subterranea TaxID=2607497 RepID=UPI0011EF4C1F|nr:Dyp-type peroxidase [Actinotalea subterranea]